MTDAVTSDDFPGNSPSLKFKQNITGVKGANSTKNVEIMVPLKYLSDFWRTREMSLINCEINLVSSLVWELSYIQCCCESKKTTFAITDRIFWIINSQNKKKSWLPELGPHTLLYRINTSDIKVRPVMKNSWIFLTTWKTDIVTILLFCGKNCSY